MTGGKLFAGAVAVLTLAAAAPATAAERPRPTGRWLVAFEQKRDARSSSAVSALLARAGAARAGRGVPQLGIVTVRGGPAAIRALRRDRRVQSVSREWYRVLRRVPNDPAVRRAETEYDGIPGGGAIQWALGRQGFFRAWDATTGGGARVAVLDTGVDGAHPELRGKIATADAIGTSDPGSDDDGHGTHTSGLACAATDNGVGVAGAGWGCRLNVVKLGTVFSPDGAVLPDEHIVDGIRTAANRGADAISMSFGGGAPNASLDIAIEYAISRGAVLVAAASNENVSEQGAPASQLQPNDAPNLNAGRGLVVGAADWGDSRPGTGYGSQISLAAYGFFARSGSGPPGVISTFPGTPASGDLECSLVLFTCVRRDMGGDDRYAYLQGTSMSTPQVAALAALLADLNPWLSVRDRIRLLKRTARGTAWNSDLGWGIIDAGAAISAAVRVDALAPSSRARARRRVRVRRGRRRARLRVRWRGRDRAGRSRLIPAGVRSYDLYMKRGRRRYRRVRRRSRRRSALLRLRPGVYRFYTRATDRAGNREAKPRRADVRVVVKKPRRRR